MHNPVVFESNANGQIATFKFEELSDCSDYMDIVWGVEEAVSRLEEGNGFRVVCLSSQTDSFLPNFMSLQSTDISKLGVVGRLISGITLPTVAHVEKNAHGLGLEIVSCADVRVCSDCSKFSMDQIRNGLMPYEGGTQRLPRIVGIGRGLELILTGRIFDSAEALEMGLVQYVSDRTHTSAAITESVLKAICNAGPIATRYFKEAVKSGSEMTLQNGLILETDLNVILQSTSDRVEGISSFIEKRSPKFRGK